MKKTIKLRLRILLVFTGFILVLTAVTTFLTVTKSLSIASDVYYRNGVMITNQVRNMINGDKFERLAKSLDEKDPYYEEIRLQMLRIRNETGVYYLYTIGQVGDVQRYVIDGSGEPGSDTFSALGDEAYPEDYGKFYFKTWETKSIQHTSLEKSEWGYLISVYEPIINSRAEMVGIVGVDFDAGFLYDSIKTQIIEQILLGILFSAAGVGIMYLITRLIFIRVDRISEVLGYIARGEGNLSTRITLRNNDEIDIMADLFNKTLDRICDMVTTIKAQTSNLFNVGNELSDNMMQTAAAVKEMTGNIQHIKDQALNQSASVTETNSTMEQVVANIDRLNTQVEAQTESVAQSSSAIEEMLANIRSVTETLVKNSGNVEHLITASDTGRTSLETVSMDIKQIAKESEGILEINAVLQSIAAQTNLLSMNAAIEAAHAGEAGRGFAVVAAEIRKLAESSSKQSKTISTVLKKIKAAIDEITKSTSVVIDKFQDIDRQVRTVSEQESNIRAAMEEQTTGSRQILDAMGKLQDITRQVKDRSEEMFEGSQQVIKESKNLTTATEEVNNDIAEIAAGAEYINSAVERVHAITTNNKEHISAMAKEVEQYKVEK